MNKPEVYYDIVKQVSHYSDGEDVEEYVTRLHNRGKMTRTQYKRYMRRAYGIKQNELRGMLSTIAGSILALTLDGHMVDVPYLGTFKLFAHASKEMDRRDAGRQAIKSLKLRFRPSRELQPYFTKDDTIFLEWKGKEPDDKA